MTPTHPAIVITPPNLPEMLRRTSAPAPITPPITARTNVISHYDNYAPPALSGENART